MWRLLSSLTGWRRGPAESTAPPGRQETQRVAARHRLRLRYSLSVLDPRRIRPAGDAELILEGHTRDISTSGLALVLPSLTFAGRDLSRVGQAFLVEIEVPSGPLRFQAAAARHARLDEDGEEAYVLGVRITEISEGDRARLKRFLREARR